MPGGVHAAGYEVRPLKKILDFVNNTTRRNTKYSTLHILIIVFYEEEVKI